MARRLRTIATNVDVIVDFDLSLRRVCGRFDVAWLGVNHFSFHARLGRRKRRIRRMMNQYRGYDCLAALTEDMADEAKQLFGQQLTRIAVLPNAVDIGWIKKRAAIDAGRPLPGDVPYIVHVARLDEVQKDHATLLRAYAEMLRRHAADEHLVIVGDGAYREALVTLARELGIAGRVHFVGQLDNPHPAMAGASMLVLSSKYEGMPMVLVEALALGKAIVATDCPTGPRAILDHGEAGMLVPVGDVSALAEAMARVLQDETLRRTLSTHAAMRAQYYDVGQSNRRLVESLEEIGCGRGRPAALF